ncbi:MAG: RNA polymerase sigma factor SigI [Clostridiaceae bacterium]|nr:RNA polymerase sigma factor SigI [Clostridiaceae bacterium]
MHPITINERVVAIKNDDEQINMLIEEYKPFIAASVERVTGRYVEYGRDDELSIALIAFVEAIRSYNITKGNFLSFSQNVIKRRIIDYYRKEKKHSVTVSINEYSSDEDEECIDLSIGKSLEEYSKEEISEYRRLEIEQLKKELSAWDISFYELMEVSPKQNKTRMLYSDIIKYIMSREDIIRHIMQKKSLPVSDIEKSLRIPRKKIERGRKYIIAVLIICSGEYEHIKDYINWG